MYSHLDPLQVTTLLYPWPTAFYNAMNEKFEYLEISKLQENK